MAAYYNENELFAAQWLRELIKAGQIADGEVDDRSIIDVHPDDIKGFTQHHWFAGIGGWSYALRLAGWPDDKEVWTGSPPCQPFSTAGKQKGKDDDRHLAPHWLELISQCKPPVVFGEQVENAIRHGWIDDLQDELERENYAVGKIVLPACIVGAPHIRKRLWFVAERLDDSECSQRRVLDTKNNGETDAQVNSSSNTSESGVDRCGPSACRVGNPHRSGSQQGSEAPTTARYWHTTNTASIAAGPSDEDRSPWERSDWILCRDDKWRPIEPGLCALAPRLPSHVGALRGYGNAIVPQVAAEVIKAFMDYEVAH